MLSVMKQAAFGQCAVSKLSVYKDERSRDAPHLIFKKNIDSEAPYILAVNREHGQDYH